MPGLQCTSQYADITFELGPYVFKSAETEFELEHVHQLNHAAFVREVPQHPDQGTGQLIDEFHHKNRCLIAMKNGRVVGMTATHDHAPYSVADRLTDPSIISRLGGRPLEVRLLTVKKSHRNTMLLGGLLVMIWEYARALGHTHVLISGLVKRQKMYERMGFVALGPAVLSGSAYFVPMVADLEKLPPRAMRNLQHFLSRPTWRRRE